LPENAVTEIYPETTAATVRTTAAVTSVNTQTVTAYVQTVTGSQHTVTLTMTAVTKVTTEAAVSGAPAEPEDTRYGRVIDCEMGDITMDGVVHAYLYNITIIQFWYPEGCQIGEPDLLIVFTSACSHKMLAGAYP
ncbi:MAG: DUF2325 domain-containing protein, partial [Oscillospiraceae bacterium]|nr:DUF2325 domain-containing protein [Oscillospiraceae bacterium]